MAAWTLSAFRDRSEMVMLTLYKSLVRSKLEYCCPVWNPSKIGDIRKLEDVQRSFTKKITGCKELTYQERLKKLKLLSESAIVWSMSGRSKMDLRLMTSRSSLLTT